MKKIMVSLVCAGSLFAFNDVYLNGLDTLPVAQVPIQKIHYDIMPYAQFSNYSGDTNKDNGTIFGVYLSDTENGYKTELDVKHRYVSYNNSSSLNQEEISLFMNYSDDLFYKFGIHYIKSDDEISDNGVVFTAGIMDRYQNYQFGSYVYYSYYSNLDTSPTFLQISPKIGVTFGNSCALWNRFYMELKVDYIRTLTNKTQNQLDNDYSSSEFSFTAYNGVFTTSMGVWFGKRSFRVSDTGFVVENIDMDQSSGFKIAENYKINNISDISVGYIRNKFDDKDSSINNFLVNYNYKF